MHILTCVCCGELFFEDEEEIKREFLKHFPEQDYEKTDYLCAECYLDAQDRGMLPERR